MKISLHPEFGNLGMINLEHGGKTLGFNLGYYNKVRDSFDVTFRDINEFWAWRGDEEGQQIFDLYEEVNNSLKYTINQNHRYKEILDAVTKLSKLHDTDLLEHWARVYSSVRYPDNLATELQEGYRAQQTYLKEEYYELTGMSIALKFMIPIWGEYIGTRNEINEIFPELRALSLLTHTTLETSKPFRRLREFVTFNLEQKETSSSAGALLEGFGTLDLPDWMFSLVVVERLTPSNLSHNDDEDLDKSTSLIANLFNHIETRLGNLEKKKNFRVRNKENDKGGRNEEDNTSTAENYTLRQNMSEVTLATFDYFTKDFRERALLVKEDIDLDHVAELVAINMRRRRFNPKEFQIRLCGIVTKPIISPRAIGYTNREGAVNLFSIAQVALHEWGFSTIADILTASEQARRPTLNGGKLITRNQIKDYQIEALNDLLPYHRLVKGSSNNKAVPKNPAMIAIERIMQASANVAWTRASSSKIEAASTLIPTQEGFIVPSDFRIILANFIIMMNQK